MFANRLSDDMSLLRTSRADAIVAGLPTLAYAIGAIGGLRIAAYAGIGVAVAVCAVAARRRPLPAIGGLVGVLFAVAIALITGRPKAFFLPGIFLNAGCAAIGVFTLAIRKPLFSFTLASLWPRFSQWRTNAAVRRVGAAITIIWTTVFLLRFVVMGACYVAGAGPSVLAVVKIVLGLPIAAVALALTVRLIASAPKPPDDENTPPKPLDQVTGALPES